MTENADPAQRGEERHAELHNPVFLYKDSGIRERHGTIPLWLLGVVAALIVWGVYYLVAYWSPPHT